MKTQQQIVKHLQERKIGFLFPEVIIPYLTFDQAKPFLREFANEMDEAGARKSWTPAPLDSEAILKEMAEYMEFAWGKARNHRGISASRSVQKMQAWTWLLGKDGEVDWDNYPNYGCPILRRICDLFGFPIPDDLGLHRMMEGKPCTEGCKGGCGE